MAKSSKRKYVPLATVLLERMFKQLGDKTQSRVIWKFIGFCDSEFEEDA